MYLPIAQFIRGEPEFVIRWYRPILGSAIVFGFIFAQLDMAGLVTCMFGAALGAAGGTFGAYRHERGLWMLAALVLLLYGGMYLMFIIAQIDDAFRKNVQPSPFLTIVDMATGTLLLTINIRFLLVICRVNWRISTNQIDV